MSEAGLSFIPWEKGPAIFLTVLYVLYTALVSFALYRTHARVRSPTQPSNAFLSHREKVLGGSPRLSWPYITFVGSIVLMWTIATAMLAHCWWTRVKFEAFAASNPNVTTNPRHSNAMGQVPSLLMGMNVLIADIILIWRCWLLYGCTPGIIVLPGLCVMADIGILITVEVKSTSKEFIRVLYPCVSLCITLYCTIAIAFKMLRYRKLKGYATVALKPALEIIAETALVYTVALVILIAGQLTTSSRDFNGHAVALVAVMAGACPTWILASVISGNGSVENQVESTRAGTNRHTLDLTAGEDEWSELDSVYDKSPIPSV